MTSLPRRTFVINFNGSLTEKDVTLFTCTYIQISGFKINNIQQEHAYLSLHTVFGNERRMPIQVSTLIPAHNALWVGTENGVLLTFPFTVPTTVAEEAGWEFIKVG